MTKTKHAITAAFLLATAGTAVAQAPKPGAAPAAAPAAAAPAAAAPAAPAPAKPIGAAPAVAPATKTVAGPAVAQAPAPAPAAKPAAPAAAPPAAPGKPAAGAPAAGAPPAAPPMPKPSKELEAFMKPFEGSWKCDTKFAANAFGPGSPEVMAKSTVKFKKEMDGFFYKGEYEVKKQKGVEMPMKGFFYIGFDPGSQQVLVTGVDSMGGMGMSVGKIEGEQMVYSGDTFGMGMKMKTRETMYKKGPKEGGHKLEVDMGKGFVLFGEDSCKK